MSTTHRIGSSNLTALCFLFLWLLCITPILLGTTNIPEPASPTMSSSPTEAMRGTVTQALGIMRDQELRKPEHMDELVTQLKKIADTRFDYREMAKRSLGDQWSKLGESDQEEFVGLFTEFLTATYVERMHSYTGEEVKFLNERLEGDYAEVRTIMLGKKTDIPLDYRLMKKDDDWKAYDVVVDGVSLVQNYRKQFAAIVRSSSYNNLVVTLQDKVAHYNVKTKISE